MTNEKLTKLVSRLQDQYASDVACAFQSMSAMLDIFKTLFEKLEDTEDDVKRETMHVLSFVHRIWKQNSSMGKSEIDGTLISLFSQLARETNLIDDNESILIEHNDETRQTSVKVGMRFDDFPSTTSKEKLIENIENLHNAKA
jgi:superfamily I DNA and RNA helicase